MTFLIPFIMLSSFAMNYSTHDGFYYLSQPYNGTEEQRHFRYEAGAKACMQLMEKGISVFSPIVHNHNLLPFAQGLSVERRREIFMPFDLTMLDRSKGMLVLKLDGWEQSHGVGIEINFCKQNQKLITYLERTSVVGLT